jgi:adenylate cyclase
MNRIMNTIATYLPQDRLRALVRGETLPGRTTGAALFADISGFTPLTESLTETLGPRRGAEILTRHLNDVYDALIRAVDRYGGSVIGFAGDAIMCWFDDNLEGAGLKAEGNTVADFSSFDFPPASLRAGACALAMQQAMEPFGAIVLPSGATAALGLKVTVASGPARRFTVGNPDIQLLDALAGATISCTATAEHLASRGEVLFDLPTVAALGAAIQVSEWREAPETHERFAVIQSLHMSLELQPWPKVLQSPSAIQLRPWLLPAVYEREQSGQGAFLTEFRPAVAMFLRFVGLDYDSDEAGPQLDAFIRCAQDVLVRYEGTLLQLTIGDKGSYLYAPFGAPIAHEDDVPGLASHLERLLRPGPRRAVAQAAPRVGKRD